MKFNKYNISKETKNSSEVRVTNNSATSVNAELETHTIYGQPFNGTQDVSGDMSNITNITTVGGDINVKATTDEQDKVGGNINADGTISGNKITADSGTIKDISGDTLNYLVGKFKELTGTKATLSDLLAGNISVETLTVTKAAHFFSLMLDEIKSVGGQIILTPANATIDKVVTVNGNFKCYWKATDGEKKIYNQFAKDDQIVCQTFNASIGTSSNVANTYYWRLCTAVGTETIDGTLYNYVVLSATDKDAASTANPTKGDKIVQLGNRTNKSRQNAIILSAYNSKFLDAALLAPSIVQYKDINDYHLETHRANVISAGFNEFKGDYKVSNGQNVEDYINTTYTKLTQKADSIESRVGKIEKFGENIVNDKQFFIHSDGETHQSREYDAATDTYTFKCFNKLNDIDYNSDYVKLEAGKYLLAFTPTVNGRDVRMLLQVSLYSDASGSNARNNQVVKYSDIPYHKLYTYEFTVTKDRPYLQLYLESSAQNNQTTLPWIVKLQNVRLLKIKESESLIKQTVDNIELKVKNTGINIEDGTITLNAYKTNVNGNLHIKGQIRKGIINIGQFNLSNYIKVEDSIKFLQLEKTGGLIIFDGYFFTDIGICSVPSLYPQQYNLSESYKNYVRSFVGQTVLIYNKSNKTIAFTGALTTPEWIDIDNFNSIEVNPNEFISMECKCGVAKNGLEKVYWVYQKGKAL